MNRKLCRVEECQKFSRAWGFCSMHFQRALKYGDPNIKHRQAKGETGFICSIDGCSNLHKAKGFCALHYQRYKRFGDPLKTLINPHGEGTINSDGYRKITINGKRIAEHRHIMEVYLGRKLTKSEIVHHIDGNRLNNSINNLVIMSQSDHIKQSPKCLDALAKGRVCRWPIKPTGD